MVLRLFKEVFALPDAMSTKRKKCISQMLARAVLDWRRHRERGEVLGDKAIINCVANAIDNSILQLRYLQTRWWIGFYAINLLHTFAFIDFLLYAQRIWGVFRRCLNDT